MMNAAAFYLFSTLLLASALSAVLLRHPVYSILSFLVSMFSLAVLFFIQKAYFVAIVQMTVYAGAILVLFLFVLMLIGYEKESRALWTRPLRLIFACILSFTAWAGLIWAVRAASPAPESARMADGIHAGTIESVGRLIFGPYLLPFELLSVALLAAIIGSVVLAKKDL